MTISDIKLTLWPTGYNSHTEYLNEKFSHSVVDDLKWSPRFNLWSFRRISETLTIRFDND